MIVVGILFKIQLMESVPAALGIPVVAFWGLYSILLISVSNTMTSLQVGQKFDNPIHRGRTIRGIYIKVELR